MMMMGEVIGMAFTGMKNTTGEQVYQVTLILTKQDAEQLHIGDGVLVDRIKDED
jgi:hypothetical protein